MSLKNFPPCPSSLKPIQHYLKTATEHEERDIVVTYWCRLYALQQGLKLDKSTPDAVKVLGSLMDWLEKTKIEQKENETIAHDIPAQAHLENYALKLFLWADSQDRACNFNKNVVKAFYTAGLIFDVLETFGQLTEEVLQNRKYAKWKAAYIHNCLKSGETPIPGPMTDDSDQPSEFAEPNNIGFSAPQIPPISNVPNIPNFPDVPSKSSTIKGTETNIINPPNVTDITNIPTVIPETSGSGGIKLSAEQITKVQKYCKFAASALDYEDTSTAVSNLQKALNLLQTGVDQ